MEIGANIAKGSVKVARRFIRLNTPRDKLCFFAKKFEEMFNLKTITEVKNDQLVTFFASMKNGTIRKLDGGRYSSVDTYAGVFKSFWHRHQKISKKKGIKIEDITSDLDTRQEKPGWAYLTEEQVKKLAENSKLKYEVLIYFLFDTDIRAPTELVNIRVSDLFNNYKEVNISQEASKTFGRRIKLMLSAGLIKEYVSLRKLQPRDQLFDLSPAPANRYLKSLALKLFGYGKSPAGLNIRN